MDTENRGVALELLIVLGLGLALLAATVLFIGGIWRGSLPLVVLGGAACSLIGWLLRRRIRGS